MFTKTNVSASRAQNFTSISQLIKVTNPSDSGLMLYVPRIIRNNNTLVLYTHGDGGDKNSAESASVYNPLVIAILNQGWLFLQHDGNGDNWGSPTAQTTYENAIAWVKAQYSIKNVVIFGGSMGNLVALNMLKSNPSNYTHYYAAQPVCSLSWSFSTWPKPDILAAYGFSLDADYGAFCANRNPIFFNPLTFKNIKVRVCSSTGDTVVPEASNALLLIKQLRLNTIVHDVATGEHGDPSHFNVTNIINHFKS